MTVNRNALRNTSSLLETLLAGRPLPSPAMRALDMIHQAEERDLLFGTDAFISDLGWRVLLVLYVAEEGAVVLPPDVFELLGEPYPQTVGWLQPFTVAGFVQITNEAVLLTRAAHTRMTAVLMV